MDIKKKIQSFIKNNLLEENHDNMSLAIIQDDNNLYNSNDEDDYHTVNYSFDGSSDLNDTTSDDGNENKKREENNNNDDNESDELIMRNADPGMNNSIVYKKLSYKLKFIYLKDLIFLLLNLLFILSMSGISLIFIFFRQINFDRFRCFRAISVYVFII